MTNKATLKSKWNRAAPWLSCLVLLGVAIARSTFISPVVASLPATPVATEIRGVWLTNVASGVLFVPWGINRALHQLSELNFNTVYPVVWNRGQTFYPSSVAKQVTGSSQEPLLGLVRLGRDVLAEIVKQGKQERLKIIPWFEYGFMAPADSELALRHPDWLAKRRDSTKTLKEVPKEQDARNAPKSSDRDSKQKRPAFIGKGLVFQQIWLNPLHPEVQQFILDLIVEVVSQYDVDGIQLDDHFGMPVELGYDPFTVRLYQQEHEGAKPPENPQDSEWMRWRADKITDFMQKVLKGVKAVNPNCLVSLSSNSQDFAYKYYLQDWQTWVERGLVEEVVLQVYRDDTNTFLAELKQPAVEIARSKIPVGIGISTGTWRRPVAIEQIQKQVQLARDRRFNGVSFFYWESLWSYIAPESPQERRDGFQSLFPSPAKRPKILPKSSSVD